MKDMQAQLDKIRTDAAECRLLSSIASDTAGRELFARVAEHMSGLASEVEKSMGAKAPVVEKTTASEASEGEKAAMGMVGVGSLLPVPLRYGAAEPRDMAYPAAHEQTARSRRILAGLAVILLVAIGGALVWANDRADKNSASFAAVRVQPEPSAQPQPAPSAQPRPETSPAPQDDAKAIAALLSTEQGERKVLSDQVSALKDQVAALAARVDNLARARAEIPGPTASPDQKEQSRSGSALRARPHTRARDRRDGSSWLFPGLQ